MTANWDWSDYKLIHGITLSFEDYRIKAYGRDDEIDNIVKELSNYSKSSTRMLRKLVSFWGSGKSTYLYNVCYNVNQRLFFGDEIEQPEKGNFSHALAFFEKIPDKRAKLLEPVYNDGLPWIWDDKTPKSEASEKGAESWKLCLRKLAFIILRRGVAEISKKHLEEAVSGGSKLRKEILKEIQGLTNLKSATFIEKLDERYQQNDQIFEECGEIMRFYFRMLLPSMEIKKGNRKIVSQDKIEQLMPQFLYSNYSSKFLSAYNELFMNPDMNLRYFPAFEKILKAAQTSILVVFDEVEDWKNVVSKKIDSDIHDIVVDAESPISIFLIFRTEVLKNIKSDTQLGTFMTIYDRLENVQLGQLDNNAIIHLTEGILDTAREPNQTGIFPMTEDFIIKLASFTKRGKTFNVRIYLRALKKLLEESRKWERPKPELTADVLNQRVAEDIVKEAIRAEQAEASKFAPSPTKRFAEQEL